MKTPTEERPATIETARLLLVVLLPDEIDLLIAGHLEAAGKLGGATFPAGWPQDEALRSGAQQPGVEFCSATIPDTNVASQRLAQKLGMTMTNRSRRDLPLWVRPAGDGL